MTRFNECREKLEHECTIEFWSLLNGYASQRMATRKHQKFILFEDAGRREMLLPVDPPDMRRNYPWFDCPAEVAEFFTHFAGLRESAPDCSGYFVDGTRRYKLASILKQLYGSKDFEANNNISDYPVLFEAANGDVVVMSPDQRLNWFCVSQRVIQEIADSFSAFITIYVSFRAQNTTPFDSYSPALSS